MLCAVRATRFPRRKQQAYGRSFLKSQRTGGVELTEPIEIGKFFKNRKGDQVVVQIKEYEGFVFCDIRQFFQDETGVSRPSKNGIAIGLRGLEDLAGIINRTLAKARELGLLDRGAP